MTKIRYLSFVAGIVLSLGLLQSRSALAVFDLNLVGGPNTDNPSYSRENNTIKVTTSSGSSVTAGLQFVFEMLPVVDFETGFMYLPRSFSRTVAGALAVDTTAKYFQIPVLLRYNLLPLISVGAGGYYAPVIGNTYNSDGGLAASARVRVPLPVIHLVAEARYLYGLKDVDPSADSLKFRDFQLLFGIGIGL